ncbi:cytochrome oxidase putative small subunit CydP [Paraburkholderia silviterrae]|uniref:Uncharacterized protein n=1 Tax=Paraburkholderia silviterrae TaxID=2528715 RepID=A0A4R5M8J6_9BURK|nr:cytochrome oxidase putative small subunit CydP [Paraburkholderia silviterrae]TDG22286.1 hypothetical protein EYW47_17565 [Paraburkholderia silviterrae]
MNSTSGQFARARPLLRARFLQWARGPTFGRDIVLVLAFKLVLLMALKYAFFNHPQAENMTMPPAAVAQALLSVPVPPEASPPGASPPGANPPQGDPHHAN